MFPILIPKYLKQFCVNLSSFVIILFGIFVSILPVYYLFYYILSISVHNDPKSEVQCE